MSKLNFWESKKECGESHLIYHDHFALAFRIYLQPANNIGWNIFISYVKYVQSMHTCADIYLIVIILRIIIIFFYINFSYITSTTCGLLQIVSTWNIIYISQSSRKSLCEYTRLRVQTNFVASEHLSNSWRMFIAVYF